MASETWVFCSILKYCSTRISGLRNGDANMLSIPLDIDIAGSPDPGFVKRFSNNSIVLGPLNPSWQDAMVATIQIPAVKRAWKAMLVYPGVQRNCGYLLFQSINHSLIHHGISGSPIFRQSHLLLGWMKEILSLAASRSIFPQMQRHCIAWVSKDHSKMVASCWLKTKIDVAASHYFWIIFRGKPLVFHILVHRRVDSTLNIMPEPCASTQISCLTTEEKVHMTRWRNLFRTIFELYPPLNDVDHRITAFF